MKASTLSGVVAQEVTRRMTVWVASGLLSMLKVKVLDSCSTRGSGRMGKSWLVVELDANV